MLSMLPTKRDLSMHGDESVEVYKQSGVDPGVLFLRRIVAELRSRAGFRFSSVSIVRYLFR